MGNIQLDTSRPTPPNPVSLSRRDIEAIFTHPEIASLNLQPQQKEHLAQLVLNRWDYRKAYEAFTGKKYNSNRAGQLRSRERFKLAAQLLQKFVLARSAEAAEWQKDEAIRDSREQINRCDRNIEELERKQGLTEKRIGTIEKELMEAEAAVAQECRADMRKPLLEVRGELFKTCVAAEMMLQSINAELRKWLKAREFWKENVDTIAGLRREGGGASASAAVVLDLSKASDETVMRLAQAKLLNQNRRN